MIARRARVAAMLAVGVLAACSGSSPSRPATAAHPATSAHPSSPTPTPSASGFALPVTHSTVWLCRPGMARNPCLNDLDTTVVQPNGATTVERFHAATNPKIDCFYVYPTLSAAPTDAAPLAPEPRAVAVARAQAALFQSQCRLFVPVYRQLTSAGLARAMRTQKLPTAVIARATADVVSAWHDYLDHDNDGRGVVLLGHSQGAGQVISLLRTEIDRSPAEKARLVAAIALGGNLLVPPGKDVGGDLQTIPACRSATQHACVVAYSTFPGVPPADAYFGRANTAIGRAAASTKGMQVLCVNPAALDGGSAPLSPYVPTRAFTGLPIGSSQSALPNYPTAFAAYPKQVTGTCRNASGASWLQITPAPHASRVAVALATAQPLGPRWGLHLEDFTIAEGNLVTLVSREASAWK